MKIDGRQRQGKQIACLHNAADASASTYLGWLSGGGDGVRLRKKEAG